MRFLSRLILMSICFELLISPIKPELVMVTVLKANAAETCAQGMEWSDAANRCLVKASTAQTQRDLEACAKLSGDDQRACYDHNANKAANNAGTTRLDSGDIQGMYKGNSFGLNAAKTAVYALPLMLFGYLMFKKKIFGKNKCLPPSLIAMMAASVVMIGGEAYGIIKHSSNLKKLSKAKDKIVNPEATDNLDQKKVNATQMQSEAFQLLADEQASVESLAKTKKTFYTVAMSAYGAAAGVAAYELISLKLAKASVIKAVAADASTLAKSDPAKAGLLTGAITALGTAEANKLKNEMNKLAEKDEPKAKGGESDPNAPLSQSLSTIETNGVTSKPLATKYKMLLAKYECYGVKEDLTSDLGKQANYNLPGAEETAKPIKKKSPSIDPDFQTIEELNGTDDMINKWKSHNQNNNNYLKAQIYHIRNAKSINEVYSLVAEFEDMATGNNFSSFNEIPSEGMPLFNEVNNKQFISLFADITASQLEKQYSLATEESNQREIDYLAKIESVLGISNAYAENGMKVNATQLLSTVGTSIASSKAMNLFSGKDTKPGATDLSNKSDGVASTTTSSSTEGSGSLVKKTDRKFNQFIETPKFRIAFGGVLGVLTGFMVKEMADQQKLAKARKETLLKLKGDFENTQGMKICTPAERNDLNQPGCYCYTADGSRNMNRSNSTTCQNLWNSINLNGLSYLTSSDLGTKVCITQSNAIDEACSCRQNNTCLKAGGINVTGISTGTLSNLGSGLTPIATVSSGEGATLNTEGVVNSAMRLRDATNKALSDKDLKNENAIIKAAENSLGKFVNGNTGTLNSPSSRSIPTSLANFNAKAALEEIKKEVESSSTVSGSGMSGGAFDTGSQEPSLEFGLTEDEAAIQEEQVAEVLKQDMDLGNNDISGSTTNLFEVLSHRYQRSGMRRLFDIEGKTEAEQPAATDINK